MTDRSVDVTAGVAPLSLDEDAQNPHDEPVGEEHSPDKAKPEDQDEKKSSKKDDKKPDTGPGPASEEDVALD